MGGRKHRFTEPFSFTHQDNKASTRRFTHSPSHEASATNSSSTPTEGLNRSSQGCRTSGSDISSLSRASAISGSESIASYSSSELAYPWSTKKLPLISSTESKNHNSLHSIQFVGPIEELQCDSTGGVYHSSTHDVQISIPEGAVDENSTVNFEFGATLCGPFAFPKDLKPVSPIVWLGIKEGMPFNRSIGVTLPHCIKGLEESSQVLVFLTGELEKKQRGKIQFEKVRSPGSGIETGYGILRTRMSKHACFVCLAAKTTREIIGKTNYRIIKTTPKSTQKHLWKVHFYVTYDLPTCLEVSSSN